MRSLLRNDRGSWLWRGSKGGGVDLSRTEAGRLYKRHVTSCTRRRGKESVPWLWPRLSSSRAACPVEKRRKHRARTFPMGLRNKWALLRWCKHDPLGRPPLRAQVRRSAGCSRKATQPREYSRLCYCLLSEPTREQVSGQRQLATICHVYLAAKGLHLFFYRWRQSAVGQSGRRGSCRLL